MTMSTEALDLPNDPAVLKAMITALQAENDKMSATLRAHDLLVQSLRVRIAKLQKQAFGANSEKIEREIEQLELALEDLQVAIAEASNTAPDEDAEDENSEANAEPKPRRRPRVADGTPRERRELDPGGTCPDCGGELRVVGEDVSELLDLIAAKLKVIEVARIKKSCRRCERMVQEPAPSRPIPRSMVGPGLLAHILTAKFDDHVPLYRPHGRRHSGYDNGRLVRGRDEDLGPSDHVDGGGPPGQRSAPCPLPADCLAIACRAMDDTPIRVLDRSKKDKGLGKGARRGASGPT